MPLPVRNSLVNPSALTVNVNKESAENFNHLKVLGVKEVIPFMPEEKKSAEALKEGQEALKVLGTDLLKEDKKVTLKKKQTNGNTEPFLEELHQLIETWNSQSTDWEGERRIILYDWEVADLIKNLLKKYGL